MAPHAFYPCSVPVRYLTKEHLTAIVDDKTRMVYIASIEDPLGLVERLRAVAQREDIHLLALGLKQGRASRVVKLKLNNFKVGGAWFDERAIALIEANATEAAIPDMTMWISQLVLTVQTTGGIQPAEGAPSARRIQEIPDELWGPRRSTSMPTGPRRPRGRPRKHVQKSPRECACGDLWPCPALRYRMPRELVADSTPAGDVFATEPNLDNPSGDVFPATAEKHHQAARVSAPVDIEASRTTPTWARGLSTLRVRDAACDRAEPADEPGAGPTPPSERGV